MTTMLRDLVDFIRSLDTPAARREQLPALLRAIGNALDSLEGRLRYLADCRGIPVELTDITQRAGGNWLSRAGILNGLGDVSPLLETMSGAVGRIWDAIGMLRGDIDEAQRSREAFENRFNAAHGIEGIWDLAAMLDTLQGVIADIDEWVPPPPPLPAPKVKAKTAAAAA